MLKLKGSLGLANPKSARKLFADVISLIFLHFRSFVLLRRPVAAGTQKEMVLGIQKFVSEAKLFYKRCYLLMMNSFLKVFPTTTVASLKPFCGNAVSHVDRWLRPFLEAYEQFIWKVNHWWHPAHYWLAAFHEGTRNEILVTWVSHSTSGVQYTRTRIFHQSSNI